MHTLIAVRRIAGEFGFTRRVGEDRTPCTLIPERPPKTHSKYFTKWMTLPVTLGQQGESPAGSPPSCGAAGPRVKLGFRLRCGVTLMINDQAGRPGISLRCQSTLDSPFIPTLAPRIINPRAGRVGGGRGTTITRLIPFQLFFQTITLVHSVVGDIRKTQVRERCSLCATWSDIRDESSSPLPSPPQSNSRFCLSILVSRD